jgi:hypothetical protein
MMLIELIFLSSHLAGATAVMSVWEYRNNKVGGSRYDKNEMLVPEKR